MEISTAGYQSLRDFIQNNWTYIELRNEAGLPIIRLSTADPRVNWTHETGAQTLQLTAVITGADADITTPVTVAYSAIFDVTQGGESLSVVEFEHPFTLQDDNYQLTVNHQIQIPQLPQQQP